MKYEKPELSIVESAAVVIQGSEKGQEGPLDVHLEHTIGAYEADE